MKKFFSIFLFFFLCYSTYAQILEPVNWSFSVKDLGEEEYDLIFSADIDEGWALYSQYIQDDGPIPTSFSFSNRPEIEYIGIVLEGEKNKITKYDKVFKMEISKYYNRAIFTQRVKLISKGAKITGSLTYMTCDDRRCLPPTDETFVFQITPGGALATSGDLVEATAEVPSGTEGMLYGLLPDAIVSAERDCGDESVTATTFSGKTTSFWSIFALGFFGGLLALLTPCIFPMVPLTVSFFTKQADKGKSKGITRATLYGVFILLVYLALSIPFHLLDSVNPDILNNISTNVWLNILFFVIFIFFAFSFFGFYELTLPSSWMNRATQGEGIGGILGIFFMALTLALVSFSCTGPILGSLLAGSLSSDGGAWQLTTGMGGFGVALGLPFALFAAFPSALGALPKSGGWLNTTKVVLGFIELALAFKFLSVADLVAHWNLLKIEPFLIIWALSFLGLALYLFGKLRFPHDGPKNKLSAIRVVCGLVALVFTGYLLSGFYVDKATQTYRPLTLLSGLAPPVGYSFLYSNECPNGLDCFKNLKEGMAYAQKENKPIMLDFTGHGCVNCRKMEEHVWPLEKVDNYLRNDYVLISLYVDDKKALPEGEQVFVERTNGGVRKLEDYGDKWAHLQTRYFQNNSQPYYVLLSPDGKNILNTPIGYTPSEKEYAAFLKCGLDALETRN